MDLTLELVSKMAYALGIGILVGLERSLKRAPTLSPEPEEETPTGVAPGAPEYTEAQFLGIRTYSVLSLSGFAVAMMGSWYPIAGAVLLAGLIGLIVVLYVRTPAWDPGITTEASAICCCCLGMLCYHNPQAAGVLAVLITILLALKRFTDDALKRLRRVELTDTLKFLVIILILLPLLPNRPLDPWEVFNPYKVVLLVVILLVAKVAKDQLGNQGLYLASLASGLADVDAITLSVTEQAKGGDLARGVAALAITIAVISNCVVKSGIAIYAGGWKHGRLVGAILMAASGAGLAVLLIF